MASIYTYNIITPSATAGADISLINSMIETTNAPSVSIKEATLSQFNDPIVETRKKQVWTPTAANSTAFALNIVAFNKSLGRIVNKTFSYTTAASGDNATSISNALAALINLDSEIPVTATGGATLTLIADAGSSDFTATTAAAGGMAGATATTVSTAGVDNTIATTYSFTSTTAGLTTLTGATGSQPVAGNGLVAGMLVRVTLNAGESAGAVVLQDGTSLSGGQSFITRLNTVSNNATVTSATITFGVAGDSNILSNTMTLGPTVALVASPPRGTGAELASRGVVGAVAATQYGELRLNWLETPVNGGAPISKSHSVFVDASSGTSGTTAYTGFRWKAINILNGTTPNTGAIQTVANPETSSAI